MHKIRILIADDHPTFREGLRELLNNEQDLEVIAVSADGQETVNLTKQLRPDVVLIDVSMPIVNGIEATKEIRKALPDIAILMLSAYKYDSYILSSLRAGASGYILKTAPVGELMSAIRLVYSGEGVFDLKDTRNILHRLALGESGKETTLKELGERELQLVSLVGKGMTNKEIAQTLILSERTVQSHLVNIFRKLQVSSRTEAVLYCLKQGWISIEDLG